MTRTRRPTAARSLAKFSIVLAAVIMLLLWFQTRPVASGEQLQSFEVEKGESGQAVAESLKKAGLIRSPLYFRLLVRQHNLSLQAGVFQLSPSYSPLEIARALTKGRSVDRKLTIPEGYRREQIAEAAGLPVKEFLSASSGLEGQLFPDTYFIKDGITAEELVKIMHDNYLSKVGTLDQRTLILASLVERETKGDSEKPIVAGILKKRLSEGWPLELDATVQYVRGKSGDWWPNTTLADRALVSPYNTYTHSGLPPAPIGNPGLTSIRAVQNAQSSPYYFYLHDSSGEIHYAVSNAEHNQNISKYIK